MREGRNVDGLEAPFGDFLDHADRLVHIAHRHIGHAGQPLAVRAAEIPQPAIIGAVAFDIEFRIGCAERTAAEKHGRIDAVGIHVLNADFGIADIAHIGALADHLEVLAFAAGLIVDHQDRAAIAFEDDIIAVFAFLDARCAILEFLGKIVSPCLVRRVDMRVGIDDQVFLFSLCGRVGCKFGGTHLNTLQALPAANAKGAGLVSVTRR